MCSVDLAAGSHASAAHQEGTHVATRSSTQESRGTGTRPIRVVSDASDDEPAVPPWAKLTVRQRRVLQVIRESMNERGYPPSMREIGQAVGLVSTSSVRHQLVTLEKKGFLHRDPKRPRTYLVRTEALTVPGSRSADEPNRVDESDELEGRRATAQYVPIVGRIAAGGPILAEQEVEEIIPLPAQMVGEGQFFALHVVGDSMIDAAICDGDMVVVRQQPQAESGEIVAAMIDGEATVKQLRLADGEVWLVPRNPAYEPIPGNDATILGRVVTVLRRL
jgi:repressor LexA